MNEEPYFPQRKVDWFKPSTEVEIGSNASPLDFLYAVFRNNDLPLTTRMRAAEAAALAQPLNERGRG